MLRDDKPSLMVDDDPPIVVVGAGIAGTAFALGAAKKGYKVTLVTKYDTPGARTQRVKVDKKQIQFLKQFFDSSDPKDRKLFEELEATSVAQIGGIEKFLHRKLQKVMASNKDSVTLITEKEGQLAAVDMQSAHITVDYARSGKRTIPFKHVIDASGTERVAYMLAHGVSPRDRQRRQEWESEIAHQPRHRAQGTASFSLAEGAVFKPSLRHRILPGVIHKVRISKKNQALLAAEFGWKESYAPNVYVITNKTRTKFYVGGDIPQHFLTLPPEEKKEAVEKWSKTLLHLSRGIDKDHLIIKGKEKRQGENGIASDNSGEERREEAAALKKINLRTTAFHLRLTRPHHFRVSTEKKDEQLVLLGDGIQSSYFHKAHGLNDALLGAEELLGVIPPNHVNRLPNWTRWDGFVDNLVRQHDGRLKAESGGSKNTMTNSSVDTGPVRVRSREKIGFFRSDQRSASFEDLKVKTTANDSFITSTPQGKEGKGKEKVEEKNLSSSLSLSHHRRNNSGGK